MFVVIHSFTAHFLAGRSRFICSQCGVVFYEASTLTNHILIKLFNISPYKCIHCNIRYPYWFFFGSIQRWHRFACSFNKKKEFSPNTRSPQRIRSVSCYMLVSPIFHNIQAHHEIFSYFCAKSSSMAHTLNTIAN